MEIWGAAVEGTRQRKATALHHSRRRAAVTRDPALDGSKRYQRGQESLLAQEGSGGRTHLTQAPLNFANLLGSFFVNRGSLWPQPRTSLRS